MKMNDGNMVKIKLWDTAGQERFRSISLSTVKNSKGIVIVFDVSEKATFEKLDTWMKMIKEENNDIPIVIFGNKCDIENRQVPKEEAEKYAESKGVLFFETSAKNNQGLNEGFRKLCENVYNNCGVNKGFKLDGKDNKKK